MQMARICGIIKNKPKLRNVRKGASMEKRDFTQIFTDGDTKVGYIPGSETVLFIKTGQGGTIYGQENRYLNLAIHVNEKYGCSVFVSQTSDDSAEAYLRDMAVLDGIFVNKSYQICYLGVSKGGLIGIWHGVNNEKIKRIAAINAPLMINFHSKTLPAIKRIGKDRLTMIYGSLDPSYKYTPFVEKWANLAILEGADHNLSGRESELTKITEELLSID